MDFSVTYDGSSLYLLEPRSEAAQDWTDEHLPDDAMTFGPAIVVEHRYIEDIVSGIQADGLTVAA